MLAGSNFTSSLALAVEEDCDSMEVLKRYSLFSEYHKNKDFQSALPFGWQVLECDKARFSKWIYYKMEDCLWFVHDSLDLAEEEVVAIEDTILSFYDMAMQYYPDGMAYFQQRKAFIVETWLELEPVVVIAEYVKAAEYNPELDSYYFHRFGQLYINNMSDENDYKMKAIDVYTMLAVREPDNPQWPDILSELVDNVDQLLDIRKKNWELDKENMEKAWTYASECIRAEAYDRAIEPLEFLTQQSPETLNYWNQLATAYNKVERYDDAEQCYIKLLELEPENKDFYFNLGLIYKEQGRLSKARQYFQTASDKAGGWGLAIFSTGLLYEQSARGCAFDFKTKVVYKLAQDTYRRAYNMDQSLAQARDRIGALSGSVPTQEDYFFYGYKSGDTIGVTGDCFGWIGKSITVP
ncbi:MAG: tetratricopeptide repeat protein [Ignavibacteria bacterium]|nr:tetratricopeptide repeat protein [Ignavibacteria bacterium]